MSEGNDDSNDDFNDVIDPQLVAKLAAWFGEGPLPAVKIPVEANTEEAKRRAALNKLLEAADDRLIDRMFARTVSVESLIRCAHHTHESRFGHLDRPSQFAVREPGEDEDEVLEYELPEDIRDSLEDDSVPQAVLRDLFRPVHFFGDIEFRRQTETTPEEQLAANPLAAVRKLMQTSHAPVVRESGWAIAQMTTDLRSRTQELALPWAESGSDRREDGQKDASSGESNDTLEHMRWFGMEGGYDPDL